MYTLSSAAPDTFFVQAGSGTIFGTFEEPREYQFSVIAVDKSGKTAVVEELSFEVAAQPQFKIAPNTDRIYSSNAGYTDPDTTDRYTVGRAYRIAPLRLDPAATTVSSGTFDDITYTLKCGASA